MRRWFFAIGLALIVVGAGCSRDRKGGEAAKGPIIGDQTSPEGHGPGTAAIKKQAKEIAGEIKTALQSGTNYDAASVQKMSNAVEAALVDWVQDKKGLTKAERDQLVKAFPEFIATSFPSSVSPQTLDAYADALKYCVELYAGRTPVNKATQDRIDSQIDQFADALKPSLVSLFVPEHSKKEKMEETAETIRKGLKASSRNAWFPGLKRPLSDEDEEGIRAQIVDQTLQTQLANFQKARSEGRPMRFDWGETSAWSAATKLVSKTIKPPKDRMIMFTHSPGMNSVGIQVKPPMLSPRPTGGGIAPPGPGGAPTPGGGGLTPPPPPPAPSPPGG